MSANSPELNYDRDLFISYSSEDREAVVAPLVEILSQFGLRVWWDQLELQVGDSLSRKIDEGLVRSRYGVVVVSRTFLERRWPEYELRGLTARELAGGKVILPAWFGVEAEDILRFSPPLADKKAILIPTPPNTEHLVDAAIQIVEVVNPELLTGLRRRAAYEARLLKAERVTVPIDRIVGSSFRHETLPDRLVARVRLLRAALLPGYPLTMESWLDGFQADAHPTQEVELWERVAAEYLELLLYLQPGENGCKVLFDFIFALHQPPVDGSMPELPPDLEEHRRLIEDTCRSKYPIIEIAEPKLPDIPEVERGDLDVVEDFEGTLSPELARRLATQERLLGPSASGSAGREQ
jgi:hypothetical protein